MLITPTDSTTPLGYFTQAFGPAAKPILYLGWAFTGLSVAACIVVGVLLLIAIMRRRAVHNERDIGEEKGGTGWVYIGTAISTLLLFGFTIYMLYVLNSIAKPPHEAALTITVTGYDWWWQVVYNEDDPQRRFVTANEIHIPTGQPVLVQLKSADVIHAFWVPLLAGKTQMIPGLVNRQWLQADKAGVYRGQCTQFCGAQHAHMAFEVIAQDEAKFQAWEDQQLAVAVASPMTAQGEKLFIRNCGGCHTVRGTEAAGTHAPDLTHVASRQMLAAGMLPNDAPHLIEWSLHAQDLKPEARMPDFSFAPEETTHLSAFLNNLR